jgi:hypothetical protein
MQRFLIAAATTTAFVGILPSASQAMTFGTDGIQFDQTTTVRFTYDGSQHFYASTLSVYRVDTGASSVLFQEVKPANGGVAPGTCSILSTKCTVDFTFDKGITYSLSLSNINPNTQNDPILKGAALSPGVFSTTSLNTLANINTLGKQAGPSNNPNVGLQRVVFNSIGSSNDGVAFSNPGAPGYTSANPFAGPVKIAFEDGGFDGGFDQNNNFVIKTPNDNDFNDFRITATVVPVPSLLPGLLGLGLAALSRQRRLLRGREETASVD